MLDRSGRIPILEWEGIAVGGPTLRVYGLSLNHRGLTGTIPPELGTLSELQTLELGATDLVNGRNELKGEIPAELGQLKNLRTLRLNHNHLTGEIPPRLAELADLTSLSLITIA